MLSVNGTETEMEGTGWATRLMDRVPTIYSKHKLNCKVHRENPIRL